MKRSMAVLALLGVLAAQLPAPGACLAESGNTPRTRIKSVAAGAFHTVGLQNDGAVVSVGSNAFGQRNVAAWTGIISVAAGECHTVGLTEDGKVLTAGINEFGQCDVDGWSDIIAVSASDRTTLGLRKDGTVSAAGDNSLGQCEVGGWTGIVAVSAGPRHSVGLKNDGTVVAAGDNQYRQCNLGRWTGIAAIAAGDFHTVGLKRDGTAVAQGYNADGRCDVRLWRDLVEVAAGGYHTVGIRRDGTAVATGADPDGRCDVGGWTGIAEIAAGKWHTVGVKKNGTAVAAGFNDEGQCEVQAWTEPGPTAAPTALPFAEDTPFPTAERAPIPTKAATPAPTAAVTPVPAGPATPAPTAAAKPAPTAAVTPVPIGTATPAPTAAATPAPQMTPAAGVPAFDSPLNGSYSNTFEVLRATLDGKTDAAYAMMIGKRHTTDSTITMTGETAGLMIFSGDPGASGTLPLTLRDGMISAGYKDEASGIEASYTGTLSRENGRVTISGEYRTTFRDVASGSVTEFSGLWTAVSARGTVSADLDTAKAKTDVTEEDIRGGWSGTASVTRIENLDQVTDTYQGEKEQMQSMIGTEFPMMAEFDENGLTLVMIQSGQEASLADDVIVSMDRGVFTATVAHDEGTIGISGVIFMEGARLALTGAIEAQMSPPGQKEAVLTLVMRMDLKKENGGSEGSETPQATAKAGATATTQAQTEDSGSAATPGSQGNGANDEWTFGGDMDPALANVPPVTPVSGTRAQTVAAGEALTVSIAENGLDRERALSLEQLDEAEIEHHSLDPELADQLVFDAYEFDAGLTPEDIIPGAFEIRCDLSKTGVPPALYDSVSVFRLEEGAEGPQRLAGRLEGSVLVAESSHNSALILSVALGLVHLAAYPIQSHRQFKEYFGDEPYLEHTEKDLTRYSFYWPRRLGFADPNALRNMWEDEIAFYKKHDLLSSSYDPDADIDAALNADKLFHPWMKVKDHLRSSSVGYLENIFDLFASIAFVRESAEWKALKQQYDDEWVQEKVLPRQVTHTIQCARKADAYLYTVRKFDPPPHVKVFISYKVREAGESLNPAYHAPYLAMPVQPLFTFPEDTAYRDLLDDYLIAFTHELFHVTQSARYVYAYDFAAYSWFYEATVIMLEEEAAQYYKTCQLDTKDLRLYPAASATGSPAPLLGPGFIPERFDFDHAYAKALGLPGSWGSVKDYYLALRYQGYMTGYLLCWLRDEHVVPNGAKADDYLKRIMEAFRGSVKNPLNIIIGQTTNSFEQFKALVGKFLMQKAPLIAVGMDRYKEESGDPFYPTLKENNFLLTAGTPIAKIIPGYSPLSSPMRPVKLEFDKQKYSKPEDISLVILRGDEAYQNDQYLPLQLGRQVKQGNAISYDFKAFTNAEGIQAFPGFAQTDFAYVQEVHLYPASWLTDYFDEPYLVFAMLRPDSPALAYDAREGKLTVTLPPRSPLWEAGLVDQFYVKLVDPSGRTYPMATDQASLTLRFDSAGVMQYEDEDLKTALKNGLRHYLQEHPEYRAELEAAHGKAVVDSLTDNALIMDLDIGAMQRSYNIFGKIGSDQGASAKQKNEFTFTIREITKSGPVLCMGPESDEAKVEVPDWNTGDIDIRGTWRAKVQLTPLEGTVVISSGEFGYDYKIETWETYPAIGKPMYTEYGRNMRNGIIELVLYLEDMAEAGLKLKGNESHWSTMTINSLDEIYRIAPPMLLHRVN